MNIERSEEQHIQEDIPALGLLLRQARLDLGMTDEEVAERLKLRVSVVREIEAMHGEQSQITTFTRGYIRSYAKLVGLDVDYLLNTNNETCRVEPVEHRLQSFSQKKRDEQLDDRVMVLTWFIFAIVIGITMFWWWQNQSNGELLTEHSQVISDEETQVDMLDDNATLTSNSHELVVVEQDKIEDLEQTIAGLEQTIASLEHEDEIEKTSSEPQIVQGVDPLAQENLQVSFPSSEKEAENKNPTDSVGNNTQIQVEPAPVLNFSSLLSMSFSADCWVDIRDANGKPMLTGIKSAGEKVELSGDTPYRVVIGAPTAVTLTFEGERVDLSRYSPKQVARFSLP